MTEQPKRSAADIEADLQRTRQELTDVVNELTNRLDPKTNAKAAAEKAKTKASEFADKAKAVPGDAGDGDANAIGILAAAGVTAALAAYLIFKR